MNYYMIICKCGRIHLVDKEKISLAFEKNMDLLLICGACGQAKLIGADEDFDWNTNETCYYVYTHDFSPYKDRTIAVSDFVGSKNNKGVLEIAYSHGIRVPMKTGEYATEYSYGIFSDSNFPDLYKIQQKGITIEEITEAIEKYNSDKTTVDMRRFMQETDEDKLKTISSYLITGLDWSGTKYENL